MTLRSWRGCEPTPPRLYTFSEDWETTMITAYSLQTGQDGHSHVTLGSVVDNEVLAAESILFEETPPHSSLDWHNAPTTQYVITLSGVLEFVTHGGETFTIKPGDILVAMDTTGSG